jgi:hypothetical protein
VLLEIVAEYNFNQAIAAPQEALLGIQQQMPIKVDLSSLMK